MRASAVVKCHWTVAWRRLRRRTQVWISSSSMDLQAIGQAFGLVRRGNASDKLAAECPAITSVEQRANELGPLEPSPLIGHPDRPPVAQRFEGDEQARRAVANVDVIEPCDRVRTRRQRLPRLTDQLLEGLIHADHRSTTIVRPLVDFQDVFQAIDELDRLSRRNTPHLFQMRAEFVFFGVRRTVSCETASITSNSTKTSANSRNVQRARPSGGTPQANVISRVS